MNDKQMAVIFEFIDASLRFMAARLNPSENLTMGETLRKLHIECLAERSKLNIFREQPPLQDSPQWEKS